MPYIYVKVSGNWIKYTDYLQDNKDKTHSRVAFHIWHDPNEDTTHYAVVNKEGVITPKKELSSKKYALLSIATGMDDGSTGVGKVIGVSSDFNYVVKPQRAPRPANLSISGDNVWANGEGCEFSVKVGETKTFPLTVTATTSTGADARTGLGTTEWKTDYFTYSLDYTHNTITITGRRDNSDTSSGDNKCEKLYIPNADDDWDENVTMVTIKVNVTAVTVASIECGTTNEPGATAFSDGPGYRFEIFDNETKTFNLPITCKDEDNKTLEGGATLLRCGNWYQEYFEYSASGTSITIQGKKANNDANIDSHSWDKIFYDANGNGYFDDGSGADPQDTPSINIQVVVKPSRVTHTYTTSTITSWPLGLTPDWSTYFEEKSTVETDIWTGTAVKENSEAYQIESSYFSGIEAGNTLRLYISATDCESCTVKLTTYWSTTIGIDDGYNVTTGPLDIALTQDHVDKIKNQGGLSISPFSGKYTLTKVCIASENTSGTTVYGWKSTGKNDAISTLTSYYTTHAITGTCVDDDGTTLSSTDNDVNVTINLDENASVDNVAYTVTLSKTVVMNNAPKRKAPKKGKKTNVLSNLGNVLSRVDEDLIEEKLNLDEITATTGWVDVNGRWNRYMPDQEEVASYPTHQAMLARTRGYDITIMDKDGKAVDQKFAMYLKVLKNYPENGDPTVLNYIVYSQRKFNLDENGNKSDQISAISFKHPITNRTFFSFEDMLLTHKDAESGGTAYSATEQSSDRDVNDMVFRIAGYKSVDGDGNKLEEKEEVDEGFPWIWVVEDLGSVDDFDFNDLVMRISSVTKKKGTPEGEGDNATLKWTALYKKVTFTPLAAGGTLPLHIHLTDNTDGKKDFYLRPGTYNLTDATVDGVAPYNNELALRSDDAEYHRWFGYTTHTSMINTGAGPTGTGRPCVLYVKCPSINEATGVWGNDGFNLNPLKGSAANKYRDNIDVYENEAIFFFVEVDGSAAQSQLGVEEVENYFIANESLGCAPQSFLIFDKQDWRWPRERMYILEAYPSFGRWVKDKDDTDWINAADVNKSLLY